MFALRWLAAAAVVLLLTILLATAGCSEPPEAAAWFSSFDDSTGWNLSSDAVADVGVADSRLLVHVFSPGQLAWGSSLSEWQDCQVTVSATQVSGPIDNEYGILLRMEDDESFLAFSVSGDGYTRVAHYADGAWSLLGPDWSPSDAVNQGTASNLLEVTAAGTSLEFRVNGQIVADLVTEEISSGPIGLYAGAFSEGDVVVAFDDLNVTAAP